MADTGLRVGVYVDAENLSRNGGDRMQYRILRNIACRENGQAIRLNTDIAFDERRAQGERDEHSPYAVAACRVNNMPSGFDGTMLPSREVVFEFELETAEGHDRPRARDITMACKFPAV